MPLFKSLQGYRDEKQGAHRDTNRRGMTEREVRMRGKKERAGVHNRWKDCGMDEEEEEIGRET